MTQVITRFAPSPTGFLHIGGARTALFNWLFARHHQGQFLLRIEDTDRQRSTPEAIDAILESLDWLELQHDGEIVYQSQRFDRHREVAYELLKAGKAYEDTDPEKGTAIRLKAVKHGKTIIRDQIQGDVEFDNEQMDDMVLLRSDGTPTYMLSVVVDDHDMDITHIIRGDDHLTNAFRQTQLYEAMGWSVPVFAHVPLIHGPDGSKLSKRHGAIGTHLYKEMGILPAAMRNYLLRLGWGHGDADIISTQEAVNLFELRDVGKSPSRFDMQKLHSVNAHYIREMDNEKLLAATLPFLEQKLGGPVPAPLREKYLAAMDELKARAKTLPEIVETGWFFTLSGQKEDKAREILAQNSGGYLEDLESRLIQLNQWKADDIFHQIQETATRHGMKVGEAAQKTRAAVMGTTSGPSLGKILEIFGKDDVLKRLDDTRKELK